MRRMNVTGAPKLRSVSIREVKIMVKVIVFIAVLIAIYYYRDKIIDWMYTLNEKLKDLIEKLNKK